MHGARGGAPEGKRNGNYRHGALTKEAIKAVRYVNFTGAFRSRRGIGRAPQAILKLRSRRPELLAGLRFDWGRNSRRLTFG
jgi:hypothetical protein